MHKLHEGISLYHGSYCTVESPDLLKCAPFKDFGRGFYLTTSKEQAACFVKTAVKKAEAQGIIDETQNFGFVSEYVFRRSANIREFFFEEADTQWLHCVVGHRKSGTFEEIVREMENYDIIGGKIADDATNFTIVAYLSGAYGTVGTEKADDGCISRLIPERLQNQFCFRSETALACLEFVEAEKIWIL